MNEPFLEDSQQNTPILKFYKTLCKVIDFDSIMLYITCIT
jgi:hypothetical protein